MQEVMKNEIFFTIFVLNENKPYNLLGGCHLTNSMPLVLLYPLKILKNPIFYFSRGYKKRSVGWNGLTLPKFRTKNDNNDAEPKFDS